MRMVIMKATWHDTANTAGDVCGFDDDTAAMLVARGLAAYHGAKSEEIEEEAKAEAAPVADKMVDPDSVLNKITGNARRRRRPAKPIGENEGD